MDSWICSTTEQFEEIVQEGDNLLQTIVTYEKATLKVISAMQVNTFITDANILKMSGYEVLITVKNNVIHLNDSNQMYLKKEYVK